MRAGVGVRHETYACGRAAADVRAGKTASDSEGIRSASAVLPD
jgi:hypothetical protein